MVGFQKVLAKWLFWVQSSENLCTRKAMNGALISEAELFILGTLLNILGSELGPSKGCCEF